ncbi:branched-chain amino acid transport [Ruminiclostridium papyrosolvens DSM 2782]|uniref:Branched-chain amino acid transport n=1 Tax=Ruminiclostridium papyrosolvens DSM 2782 TaxID=588581 RepID=F1TCC6_9FIRM|nr:AzlD domain-containing protein [Ruminiclostridium papyrosolvens]EGD48041.1 branched-chain amino acid transport [Ruminiclostridium papyrosolvens DSM 2782]WES35072.1 AzlD domain-containing protein [Ruminiclostridium papyrosolvens DSM 2782]
MTNTLIAVFLMALVTYIPRVLPMAVFKNKIKSRFITAFLGYVPYAVLGAMIFPDILTATGHLWSAVTGLGVAVILAYFEKSLLKVAVCAIAVVYICEMIISRV